MWVQIIKDSVHIHHKLQQLVNHLDTIPVDYRNIGLLSGETGRALFYAYYAKYAGNENYIEKANTILSGIVETINSQQNLNPLFSNGITGVFWTIRHLTENHFIDCDFKESFGALNNYLGQQMMRMLDGGNYDFLHGSLGIANYLIDNPENHTILKQHIQKLDAIGQRTNGFIHWKSIIQNKSGKTESVINLGLSHGMASIVAYLNKYMQVFEKTDEVSSLSQSTINFIRSREQNLALHTSFFPDWVSDDPLVKNSRLRWCYGDLGIAYSLYRSSLLLQDKELEAYALNILLQTSKRKDAEKEGVADAGLCHGAMGVAHMYNRLYQISKNIHFKSAAEYWYKVGLNSAIRKDGIAGFQSYNKVSGWVTKPYFLEGASGTGLALITAVSEFEPKWDACLLLS